MSAPNLTFSVTGERLSAVEGSDHVTVTFQADAAYTAFECRITKSGEEWGLGKGTLAASFSQTPAGVSRTFEVYDDFLANGDGQYRISLYVQGTDGSWNDNHVLSPAGDDGLTTAEGAEFLCMR